jgi:hypothetical protein
MFDKLFLRDEMKRSYLIQRLQKPEYWERKDKEGNVVKIDNPYAFGGGLTNGGLSKEAMALLREIFSFDYMGSAEFEWGAVPAALRFLVERAYVPRFKSKTLLFLAKLFKINIWENKLVAGVVQNTKAPLKPVWFVCPKEYEKEVRERIYAFRKDEPGWSRTPGFGTREYCGLHDYFAKDDDYHKKNLGWLELDNGFAFFVDKEMFTKFCETLNPPIRFSLATN